MHVHGVDQLAALEELEAGHALVGDEDRGLGELRSVRIKPSSNLYSEDRKGIDKSIIRVKLDPAGFDARSCLKMH